MLLVVVVSWLAVHDFPSLQPTETYICLFLALGCELPYLWFSSEKVVGLAREAKFTWSLVKGRPTKPPPALIISPDIQRCQQWKSVAHIRYRKAWLTYVMVHYVNPLVHLVTSTP